MQEASIKLLLRERRAVDAVVVSKERLRS